MSSYSEGQIHQLANALEAVGMTAKHITRLGQSSALLENILLVLDGKAVITMNEAYKTKTFTIKRGRFSPTRLIGQGWDIDTEETDTRSIALTELHLTRVQLVTTLKDGEPQVNGDEKRRRLKKLGKIRLDADIFFMFWENKHLIPESWKEGANGQNPFINFDGTILRHPLRGRCVLCLYWDGDDWRLGLDWLNGVYKLSTLSAVLER